MASVRLMVHNDIIGVSEEPATELLGVSVVNIYCDVVLFH